MIDRAVLEGTTHEKIEPEDLEGLAKRFHDHTGIEPPISGFDLLALLRVSIRWRGGSEAKVDLKSRVCSIGTRARPVRQNGRAVHEAGHVLLFDEGMNHLDEDAVRYLAGALMIPRARLLSDLTATDWDLFELQRIHVHASAEMIVVRMTQVSPATAAVWDGLSLARDYGRGAVDRELVDEVLGTERPARLGAVRAWPIISKRTKSEPEYRRVIVVRAA